MVFHAFNDYVSLRQDACAGSGFLLSIFKGKAQAARNYTALPVNPWRNCSSCIWSTP